MVSPALLRLSVFFFSSRFFFFFFLVPQRKRTRKRGGRREVRSSERPATAPKLDDHAPLAVWSFFFFFLTRYFFLSSHAPHQSARHRHWVTEPFYLIRSIQPPAVETAAVSAICLGVLPSSSPVGSALSKFHYEMAGSTRGCSLRLPAWHVTGWSARGKHGRPQTPRNFGTCVTFRRTGSGRDNRWRREPH